MSTHAKSAAAVDLAQPRNRLLAALPPAERALIAAHLEPFTMERRRLLYDPERPIEHVYFVEEGIVSILSVLRDGSAVETATIGWDGMIGMPIFHGIDTASEQAMVQMPGVATRMTAAAFRELAPQLPSLHASLHRFSAFLFTLVAQNSACNRKHTVEERCARWLAIVHDRVDGDNLALTHDFISQMLGVRRASVTDTLSAFEKREMVATGRNLITVTDRAALEKATCECYGIITAAYERLMLRLPSYSALHDAEISKGGFSTVGDGTPMTSDTDAPGAA